MVDKTAPLDDMVLSFLAESREMIDEVEPQLVGLGQLAAETGQVDIETLNLVFRLFHSLKGSAGFFNFNAIVGVTHVAETLLDMFRNGSKSLSVDHSHLLCRTCDLISLLLEQVETTGVDTGVEGRVEEISQQLHTAIMGEYRVAASTQPEESSRSTTEPGVRAEPDEAPTTSVQIPMADLMERFVQEADEQIERVEDVLLKSDPDNMESVSDAFRALHSFKGNCGFLGLADLEQLSHAAETVWVAVKEGRLKMSVITATMLFIVDILRGAVADVSRGGVGRIDNLDVLVDMLRDLAGPELAPPDQTPGRAEIQEPEAMRLLREEESLVDNGPIPVKEPTTTMKARSVLRNDIRVDLKKLDQLINLVGELVIAEQMVTRNPDLQDMELENFDRAAAHLDKVVRDLQDVAMSVRMIPVSGIFNKAIRLVHDLSAKAGKKVNLRLEGEETEIDKTVAEHLADPLVHLVRNAVDHGIESPADRVAAGKEDTGQLVIEAKHEGGEVWIIITDDGRGLSREKILAKGMERGLVQGDGESLRDDEVFQLIFEPGFSTAEKVTDISGRGVGMDVVKKNLEKIKGRVDINSRPGQGATFILRIPLTLAIMEGMLVRVGQARYTIPILSIRESIQVRPEMVTKTMDGMELVMVRGTLLPVLRLHHLHKIKPDHEQIEQGLFVIVESHDQAFGVLVDEILGEQHTVIKGLSRYMGEVRGISGCTILGDGEISLILDVGGLMKMALSRGQLH